MSLVGQLALMALLLAGYALVAKKLDKLSIGPALAFVAVGLLVSDEVIGPVALEPAMEPVKLLAEAALTLVLFADASEISARAVRRDAWAIVRLLLVGLMLTIVLGTAGAALIFPGISLGVALLIGAALAPTDAALGQAVVSNEAVPARIRRLLNIESGLNDGIATPFVFLAIALASAEATGTSGWLLDAVTDSAIGAVVGLGLGFVGGRLLEVATARGLTSGASRQLFVLALAVSSYLLALSLGGNGFIAAFVGGLAFGAGTRHHEERAIRFTQVQGSLLAIGVWASFGLLLAGELRTTLWNVNAIVFAVLSLTVLRMLPVAIALAGMRMNRSTVLFMGWFGPRGLASIVFLIIGLEALHEAGVDPGPTAAAVTWTVLLSVVLHGITAGPLSARYAALTRALRPGSPEFDDDVPLEPRGVAWSQDEHVVRP